MIVWPGKIGSGPLPSRCPAGVRVSDTAALSCSAAVSWNPGDRLVNVPPSARNDDFTRGLTGPFGWLIAAISPNGRLNSAANGTPAATFSMLLVSTGCGANGTSCWLSGAATSSGRPSLPGLGMGPSGPCGPGDSIGSHDTCGTANVAMSAPLSARLIPSSANAGAWAAAAAPAPGALALMSRSGRAVAYSPTSGAIATPNRSTLVDRSSSASDTSRDPSTEAGTATSATGAGAASVTVAGSLSVGCCAAAPSA